MEFERKVNDESALDNNENVVNIDNEEPLFRIDDIQKVYEEKLANEQKKTEDAMNMYLRSMADFQNYKRNTEKIIANSVNSGKIQIIKSILPVIDNFERAIENNDLTDGNVLIYNTLMKALTDNGLEVINPENCDMFDDNFHNAISIVPNEELKGQIVETVLRGYKLGDTIIRHANVIVYN